MATRAPDADATADVPGKVGEENEVQRLGRSAAGSTLPSLKRLVLTRTSDRRFLVLRPLRRPPVRLPGFVLLRAWLCVTASVTRMCAAWLLTRRVSALCDTASTDVTPLAWRCSRAAGRPVAQSSLLRADLQVEPCMRLGALPDPRRRVSATSLPAEPEVEAGDWGAKEEGGGGGRGGLVTRARKSDGVVSSLEAFHQADL